MRAPPLAPGMVVCVVGMMLPPKVRGSGIGRQPSCPCAIDGAPAGATLSCRKRRSGPADEKFLQLTPFGSPSGGLHATPPLAYGFAARVPGACHRGRHSSPGTLLVPPRLAAGR